MVGLNFDFVGLNTTGYLAYALYNVCLFFIIDFREAYFEKFPGSTIPVQINDLLFACHGFVINVLLCIQCYFYERGNQTLSTFSKGILTAVYSPAIVLTLFYLLDGVNKYYYVSFFSYVKLGITLFKYFPQVRENSKIIKTKQLAYLNSQYYSFFRLLSKKGLLQF